MNLPLRAPAAPVPPKIRPPRPPKSISDTGLDLGFLIDLLVKTVYRMSGAFTTACEEM